MPRSAAQKANRATQKANRRLREQTKPSTFPFTQLPAELQLLVLCKCDFVSVGRLLRLSPHLSALFVRYPENTLRDILAQIPPPLAGLVRMSWALHKTRLQDFDSKETLNLLRSTDLLCWAPTSQRIFGDSDVQLGTIHDFIDLYVEVDVAVELVAQGLNATMEALVNPRAVVAPVVLSTTEYTRIACSLFIVKIYCQLQTKFIHHCRGRTEFPAAFMTSLKPWQVQQAMSVEQFLQACIHSFDFAIYRVIEKKHMCFQSLSEKSSYFQKYLEVQDSIASHAGLPSFIDKFSSAASRLPHPLLLHPQSMGSLSDVGHPPKSSQIVTQLRNHGWIIYMSGIADGTIEYDPSRLLTTVGLLFWDQDRLMGWSIVDQGDVATIDDEFYRVTPTWGYNP
ncbi:uncharacterized protein K460DRAFT_391999 [Cucurbitaria berberidis CBS 394.84]|uniref:F-box domain-containing protein n=1 Tax=Cucurbitaria berberidis CBS 394.84 TaxID=1168544 RepID=A0A9P4GUY4_9PLEO|nr:uncharacterized protein K460DRAFT_391999 [Cucurbitaria berberidis CBS 394.84]KAF1851787.1 hypothetical protein K460DRAFT_391999 [Cucurbitaria berberidis CBS 394.84]